MKDLILETSLRDVALGIFVEGEQLFQKRIEKGRGEILSDLLDEALQSSFSSMDEITRVLVTLGPGSFTGLRVGLAFAQGICFSGKRELYGISTLSALATCAEKETRTIVVTRAKPGLYFVGTKEAQKPIAKELEHEVLMTTEQLVAYTQDYHHLLIDSDQEAELLTQLSVESVSNIWEQFDLKNYAQALEFVSPLPIDQVVPNYIQEPYAK